MNGKTWKGWILTLAALVAFAPGAHATGMLTPAGAADQPLMIRDHDVRVVIDNGFAMTEVQQTFFNPNARDVEATYAFPVPRGASLSEFTVWAGEVEMQGEVLPADEAQRIYEEEREAGNDAGHARKNSFYTFEFRIARIPPQAEVRTRFVYYQPLEIDTGVGRYLYPLEDGGTDDAGASFWTCNSRVERNFSLDIELKSAVPVAEVRAPGFEAAATVERLEEGHYRIRAESQGADLTRDFILYYRLQEGLPGRLDVVPYRANGEGPGTFMMVVTPGIDLAALDGGADYVFVLDVSGSMQGKIASLANGVSRAVKDLRPQDRFRVVTFCDRAEEVVGWSPATPEHVQAAVARIEALGVQGGTNLYAGLQMGLGDLDADRATSLVLVTDAVANVGEVKPARFEELLRTRDVRVFGFLLGNSGNWPLMRAICDVSGGFYAPVSNADDILGQLILAKEKVTHECLHDVRVEIGGVKTFDLTTEGFRRVYHGQQLVLFGRYKEGGRATVTLRTRQTGEDRTYATTVDLPDLDTDAPEIERLWAMAKIEAIESQEMRGKVDAGEAHVAIRDLGTAFQIVTDYTSMVVLSDKRHEAHGIERRNRDRAAREHQAQQVRAAQAPRDTRADRQQPMFNNAPAHHVGGGGGGGGGSGGGAFDPMTCMLALGAAGAAAGARRRRET
ncbi:MAG: VWA domain-containing protein [Planctomycetes bacterium]|nr:VWA domain-containing protein [Planctomycetota bacterium]